MCEAHLLGERIPICQYKNSAHHDHCHHNCGALMDILKTASHNIHSHAHYHSVHLCCAFGVIYYPKCIPLQKQRTGWHFTLLDKLSTLGHHHKFFQHVFTFYSLILHCTENNTRKSNMSCSYIHTIKKKYRLHIGMLCHKTDVVR